MSGRILTGFVLDQLLEAFADAEDEGRRLTTPEVQAIAGWGNSAAPLVRRALAERGLLTIVAEHSPGAPAEVRLTEAAWLALGRLPKARLVRTRSCLRCQTPFRSRNPGHRRCDPCSEAVKRAGASWDF